MNKLKIYFVFISFLFSIAFTGCKKDTNPDLPGSCEFYSTVSSDTNYIPHKINNYWNYCDEASTIAWAGWSAKITLDTVIGNNIYFDKSLSFQTGHSGGGAGTIFSPDASTTYMIDSIGYYFLYYRNYNTSIPRDTILIIKPSAMNGDTIYSNALANVKVVLIDKNETLYSISGCYHSRVILNAFSSGRILVDHYFKKGIGELYVTGNTEKKEGKILSYATIN